MASLHAAAYSINFPSMIPYNAREIVFLCIAVGALAWAR